MSPLMAQSGHSRHRNNLSVIGQERTLHALVAIYLPSFQISAASFQSLPTFSHTTTYLPVTSLGVGPLVFKLKVPISRAANRPSRLTSMVVTFGSPTCSAMPFHIAAIAALPFTMPEPGGNAVASSV